MNKQNPLPEKEIQDLEAMASIPLTDYVSAIPHQELQAKFIALLHSYRLAARVANAAWRFNKACEATSGPDNTLDASEEMYRALHDYSPANWMLPVSDVHVIAKELGELSTEIDQTQDGALMEGVQELIYNRLMKQEAELNRRRALLESQQSLPNVRTTRTRRDPRP